MTTELLIEIESALAESEEEIREHVKKYFKVMGSCGGFQINGIDFKISIKDVNGNEENNSK